jgi:thioredoxin 1
MLEPEDKKLAQEWGAKVKVVKLDIDSNPDLTMQYQVIGVPTLMLFMHGEPVERASGFQPKDRLAQKFNPHLR